MLAGRKLLLADDSVTIQKVIDLTFADEGVRVFAFSNGQDAIDHIAEVAPDVVLADVFMPFRSGYEVCEYVKKNEQLKHIPVMLLVGSFEPFDEAEARRVGADDILTKPFQSIRRLIERVGALVGKEPGEVSEATAEFPKPQLEVPGEQKLSTGQLEVVTADTRPLSADANGKREERDEAALSSEPVAGEQKMETVVNDDAQFEAGDALLDLGDLEPRDSALTDDFVLDLDLEDTLSGNIGEPVKNATPVRAFVEPEVTETAEVKPVRVEDELAGSFAPVEDVPYEDQVHEIPTRAAYSSSATDEQSVATAAVPERGSGVPSAQEIPTQLTPEMIDAIARRAVELMSDKVIREIAWEVVPELSELLIKRHLENQSQPK